MHPKTCVRGSASMWQVFGRYGGGNSGVGDSVTALSVTHKETEEQGLWDG